MNNPINYWYQKYLNEKQKNEGMIEALRTEYEKGRADAIAQMQKEWGEDDEHRIKLLEALCEDKLFESVPNSTMYEEMKITIDWLKSLKPQNTWKPSDEQMVVLELASKYERVFTPKQIDILIGLKEQLKKLKGE